jgi:hypothetical protein
LKAANSVAKLYRWGTPNLVPTRISTLVALYFAATLAHFAHNAEYIAFYPNMPGWITRETVYVAWLCVTAVGVVGLVLARSGWRAVGALVLAAYGLLGLDGLGHYALALCTEHTLSMNFTILFEVFTGIGLATYAGTFSWQLATRRSIT